MTAASVWTSVKSYFNVAGDLESQPQIEASIRSGVSFRGAQLLVLIFAIFVASLGLNTDSIPVIIGAMLISPLMGPIIGMGLGIGIHDFDLLRRGMKNIFMAVVGSLAASAVYFLISPQYEGSSQLLARTSPSIYDVFIALFGGAAGIVSIAAKNKGQVMPGVAIATSLMPPLCTAGYGLATLQWQFFFGALYLFFTNMVFILFATWTGVKAHGAASPAGTGHGTCTQNTGAGLYHSHSHSRRKRVSHSYNASKKHIYGACGAIRADRDGVSQHAGALTP